MIRKYYRVDRREICLLRFILEGYDGMAIMTTIDSRRGIVMIRIASGCEDDVEMILEGLGKDILIETLYSQGMPCLKNGSADLLY